MGHMTEEANLYNTSTGFDSRQVNDENFCICHRVQTGSGTHSSSYPMNEGGSSGVKRPEREVDHSHLVPKLMFGAIPPPP